MKSLDAFDRKVLDGVLSSFGLPDWFRHAYFEYHALVRLRFQLASGFGVPLTRDGVIPQCCILSMMFTDALHLPWCTFWQLRSGSSLKCMLIISNVFLATLVCFSVLQRFTIGYVRLVGQESASGKCVLLSTSHFRKDMKEWLLF